MRRSRTGIGERPPEGPDYWLGERGEYVINDFDGRLRACYVLGRAERPASDRLPGGRRYPRVEPPLRTAAPMPPFPGGEADKVVVCERHIDGNLDELDRGWLAVWVCTVANPQAVVDGDVDRAGLSMVIWGDIAREPSQLEPSHEESFEHALGLLRKFVGREGHLDVPDEHREDGVPLANWINSWRYEQARGRMRPEWVDKLENVPGWTWLSGDDFFLMARFARREGHTDVPTDHREEGRPLGRWAQQRRRSYAMGWLHPDDLRRTEAIPHWHW